MTVHSIDNQKIWHLVVPRPAGRHSQQRVRRTGETYLVPMLHKIGVVATSSGVLLRACMIVCIASVCSVCVLRVYKGVTSEDLILDRYDAHDMMTFGFHWHRIVGRYSGCEYCEGRPVKSLVLCSRTKTTYVGDSRGLGPVKQVHSQLVGCYTVGIAVPYMSAGEL